MLCNVWRRLEGARRRDSLLLTIKKTDQNFFGLCSMTERLGNFGRLFYKKSVKAFFLMPSWKTDFMGEPLGFQIQPTHSALPPLPETGRDFSDDKIQTCDIYCTDIQQ